ncbi:MAG: hypothetical protein CMQ37_00630 [Gammaproteobacteria bacterium]|nr:hypothetical protein [Gammaproteobacteria bacterium]
MSRPETVKPDSASVIKLRAALAGVRKRRQRLLILKQTSLVAIALIAAFLGLSTLSVSLPGGRGLDALLFLAFIAIAGVLVWRYLRTLAQLRQDDRQLAGYVESRLPDLEQRLLTSLEFSSDPDSVEQRGVSQQFVQQLWDDADTQLGAQQQRLLEDADNRMPWLPLSVAGGAILTLVVLLTASDALWRAGSSLLWPFRAGPELALAPVPEPVVEPADMVISVEPGDISMQRGRAATIEVRIENAIPDDVRLRMRSDQVNWYDANMQRDGSGSNGAAFSYYLPAVEEDLVYYVSVGEGDDERSREYRITLYDLPQAEQIDVAYDFPEYTGIDDFQENDSGDFVVPEGTSLTLDIMFNKAVTQADLVFEDDTRIPVTVDGDRGQVTLIAEQDRSYRVLATDFEQLQTEDADIYYLRTIPDEPPELALHSPGRDQDVMPLEEVILQVEATDDYGLSDFTLHYSVIGSDEVAIDFLPEERTRNVTGNQMIYMEDLVVSPGDFVSYYLTVADNNGLRGPQEVVSDIYFLQVVPTDQEFRRASGGQQGGGGGGGGGDTGSALVTLQKDIIAATWRLRQQQLNMDQQQFSDDVAVIAESQRDASERAQMSIDRLSERVNFADDSYGNAVTYLQRAIEQMEAAAADLDQLALTQAMTPEQQALQYVLRAEAEINQTDVSFQQQAGGGGGGGSQQERQDLRELFDMEMGQNENRYETPRQASQGGQNTEEASRLEELARRQEGLTRAQRNLARRLEEMDEEQRRRELERLRRDQEQISNELAQLQQQMSRRQQMSQGQQNSQAQAGGSSQQLEQMQRTIEQMQEAAQAETPAQAAARSQRALDSLREQQRQLAQQSQQSPNQLVQDLAQRGQQLQQQQRQLQQSLEDLSREQGLGQSRQSAANDEGLQELTEQQQRLRQELEEIDRMLRAVIARAGNDEQQTLAQAQEATRALRPLREQMDTSNRVLRNGMVNLAVDIEQDIAEALADLSRDLQGLEPGNQLAQQTDADPINQAAADASALRRELEALQEQISNGRQESIGQMRERLARSQQLAQQLDQQLSQAGEQQAGEGQPSRGQLAQRGQQGNPGNQAQPGGAASQVDPGDQRGIGRIPAEGEAALWGNARSISTEITGQSLEAFMNQPELLQGVLQPLIELESDLRARAELARITRRLYTVSEEDIPEEYRQLVEDYYRALSENRSATP